MKFLLFLGTVRDSTPPHPARLGECVAIALLGFLNEQYPDHAFELIDALDYPMQPVFKPHFAYSKRNVPAKLDELAHKIEQADGYLMISPEYNHSMSPALANLLNHFGSSLFSYKPSAIVTYSAGQWGGLRAAVNMRTFLAELGCLPVSAMIHIPTAQAVLDTNGAIKSTEDKQRWLGYFERTVLQLLWWAEATNTQRSRVNPHDLISSFTNSPDERNAP